MIIHPKETIWIRRLQREIGKVIYFSFAKSLIPNTFHVGCDFLS